MKGVILAGGKGLRLYPLTKVINKHLLPVGREPMILNPIRKLIEAKISEILVVTSSEHMGDIVNLLGSGKEYRVNFTYKVQESALGIAQALSLAENFAHNEKIVVILGYNITPESITPYIQSFRKQKAGAKILLKKVEDASRFGIAAIDEHQVLGIEEKPRKPKSSFAVLGYYMYDADVFNIIKEQKPSGRGEYEITDVTNVYIKRGTLTYDFLKGDWTDAGTFDSLAMANNILLRTYTDQKGAAKKKQYSKVSKDQLKTMIQSEEKKLEELRKHLEG